VKPLFANWCTFSKVQNLYFVFSYLYHTFNFLIQFSQKSEISARKDGSGDESNNGATKESPLKDININCAVPSNQNLRWMSQHREIAPSSYQEIYFSECDLNKSPSIRKTHKCCVYFSGRTQYCARLNSVQAFGDINRDVRILCLKCLLYLSTMNCILFLIICYVNCTTLKEDMTLLF
jgi:hypothetical protein